jgi:acyl-CoA thioesterase I
MPKPARPFRPKFGVSAAGLTWLAAVGFFLFAAAPTRADEARCPNFASAFDTNGAKLAIPKGDANDHLEILAIGSSSTQGIGASAPSHTYPAQLETELAHDDGIVADVKNAGVGGELAAKTLPRLLSALKVGWAELIIWQVGTNDAIAGVDETVFRATVEKGVAAARAASVPLLLMDQQFTPMSPDEARYERFVAIVHDIGARQRVPVLSRFAMMKRFGAKSALALLSRDGLHMNDMGYQCVAHALAEAIESASSGSL